MIDNMTLYSVLSRLTDDDVDDGLIESIINRYHEYPQYVIKYISVYHPETCGRYVVQYISRTRDRNCDLIDCILSAYTVKLCDTRILKQTVCIDGCRCYSRECWRYMYDSFIHLIESNPTYFSLNNIYNNFVTLVSKTDVSDKHLLKLMYNLSKTPRYWRYILRFIKDSELYGSDYGDLVFAMRDTILENDKLNANKKNRSICEFQDRTLLASILHRYNESQNNMSKVTDNIYITDIDGARNVSIIKDKNIQYIVTITKKDVFHISGIEYAQIMIDDISSVDFVNATIDVVDKVVEYIQNNKVVLIHCYKGQSRSVSFVILVLVRQGMSFDKAFTMVKKARPSSDPNPEFLKQILEFIQKELELDQNKQV